MAGFFDTLFGGGAQKDAAAQNAVALQGYYGTGNQDLAQALGPSLSALQGTLTNYQGLQNTLQGQYGAGSTMLANAYGLNGPAGVTAAQNAFTTSPQYQQGIDANLQGIARLHALAGMGSSGGTDIAAGTMAQNAQNQQWQNWMSGIQNMINPQLQGTLTAAGGAAGAGTGIANLYQGNVANQIGLLTGLTQGTMANNNMVAQGEQAGANNLLGAIGGIAKLGSLLV